MSSTCYCNCTSIAFPVPGRERGRWSQSCRSPSIHHNSLEHSCQRFRIRLESFSSCSILPVSMATLPSPSHEGVHHRAYILDPNKSIPVVPIGSSEGSTNTMCACNHHVVVADCQQFPSWRHYYHNRPEGRVQFGYRSKFQCIICESIPAVLRVSNGNI